MQEHYGKHAAEPVWRRAGQLRRGQLPAALRDWLLDRGSLTQRLQRACPGAFGVQVLYQGWGRPLLGEALALGQAPVRRALVREVLLLCGTRPWVFARTVIPLASLRGTQRRLAYLGQRPLGAVLFADPHLCRGPVEVAAVRPGQRTSVAAALPSAPTPWGRRSVFRLDGRPLLVSEFFLPALLEAECRVR